MNSDILEYYKFKIMKRFDSLFAYAVSDDDRELFLDALTEIESDIKQFILQTPAEKAKDIEAIVHYVLQWQNNNLN